MQPTVKAERHCQIKSSWLDLQARMPTMSDVELQAALVEKKKADLGMLSLNLPASNAAMRSLTYHHPAIEQLRVMRTTAREYGLPAPAKKDEP